ncbi:MAG: UDP-N-acetylmuramate--L-alanine ligase [Thermodesulfovibrionia bacterium]|nr:UDP-N-acetylmuramate--L-alanine ligase [Thermodesulfovibrionia bacterium]MCK5426548.1 UDP-N-acetylmuramate--L-alanine ligase [Thermodesulfovibrionia bacterium]
MNKQFEVAHFIGIGGTGMSGIAEVLKNLGYEVRGSDLKKSDTTRRLEALGIHITIGHSAENIKGAHVVVVSSAVSPDNPEIRAAKEQSIPVIPRAEMLAELARLKYSVLIAGAHGKTTTTSLVAHVLVSGGLDPTVVIGGKLKDTGSNAKVGQGEYLIAEADESDGSFLKLSPTIAVVTNIDREHLDYFKTIEELKKAFLSFVNKVPFYGASILCADDDNIKELLPKIQRRFFTYGLGHGLDIVARNVKVEGLVSKFEVIVKGASFGFFEVPLPGIHNVYNTLAAIGVAYELGLDINNVRQSLENFSGVQRRFELRGEVSGIRVFDDYGHHPTEIISTLRVGNAIRLWNAGHGLQNAQQGHEKGKFVVVFQPHRYTRTRDLLHDFFKAFADADKIILMDIFPAGEKPIDGINTEVLCNGIKKTGKEVVYMRDRTHILKCLDSELRNGDILLTLGAGDVWKIGEDYLKMKKSKFRIKEGSFN